MFFFLKELAQLTLLEKVISVFTSFRYEHILGPFTVAILQLVCLLSGLLISDLVRQS